MIVVTLFGLAILHTAATKCIAGILYYYLPTAICKYCLELI